MKSFVGPWLRLLFGSVSSSTSQTPSQAERESLLVAALIGAGLMAALWSVWS